MSIYVGPWAFLQATADHGWELDVVADHFNKPRDGRLVRLDIKTRALLVSMGAIELSRREFVQKLEEIAANGRGLGPRHHQIDR